MDERSKMPKAESERRRSQRLLLSIAISVEGETPDHRPFREDTRTLVVSAHGALIRLASEVKAGQKIVLRNPSANETQVCRVVYVGQPHEGKIQIGVEFTEAAPQFWHITFPPDDWAPAKFDAGVRSVK